METKYEHKPELTFIGFSAVFNHEEGYRKCPEFWEKEYYQRFATLCKTMKPQNALEAAIVDNKVGMFAVCQSNGEGQFEYAISGLYQGGEVPEGLKLFTYPESDWALFPAKGPLPTSLQSVNTEIWEKWFPTDGIKLGANPHFNIEFYSPGDANSPDYECGIWIPLANQNGCADPEINN